MNYLTDKVLTAIKEIIQRKAEAKQAPPLLCTLLELKRQFPNQEIKPHLKKLIDTETIKLRELVNDWAFELL